MSIAVVAEKPSVARDLAAALGAIVRGNGYFEGSGYVVTWAIGHLVALAQPHEIEPAWKRWSLATLPMLPTSFPLVVVDETKAQFAVVRRILRARATESVICATDAGREGELIFRYIYEAAGCTKAVRRLWISSLTPEAIRNGLSHLKSARDYDRLADAAKGRSRADWLVGMNLSRAYSLSLDQEISVGRVQTPTLALLVDRSLAIRDFVPEDFRVVVATFGPLHSDAESASYEGHWFQPASQNEANRASTREGRLPPDGQQAAEIVARSKAGHAAIRSLKGESRRQAPPLLYDLTELQRHANRLFGMSAQRTLDVAQSLYERHKLLSYPRTDSRYLSRDVAATLDQITTHIGDRYPGLLAPGTGTRPLGRRFVDDSRVTDHHAIVPTTATAKATSLSSDEQRIYDLVCRRLLQAYHDDHILSVTTIVTTITNDQVPSIVDSYVSRGTRIDQLGWKQLDLVIAKKSPNRSRRSTHADAATIDEPTDVADQALPRELRVGTEVKVLDAASLAKQTKPPKAHTEATLLTAMEHAGQSLEEKEFSEAMSDLGLGTPATRAQIIETLLRRNYVVRRGKSLEATDKGIALIDIVHADVKSPAMTGEWEGKLKRLQRGEGDLASFLAGIEGYVADVVGRIKGKPRAPRADLAEQSPTATHPPKAITPAKHSGDLRQLLQKSFGFPDFRPHQQAVCQAATDGKDVLLVMPTGAGKSLCYQLPGIARQGTALVISPLIALMDDQANKLERQGFHVACIHSGRARVESRRACVDYLDGKLDFLFIAPERLSVPGFPQLLAKRIPSLIAVDEAHCISQWGHDFRPDYRLLGQRLPSLRPAPIVALTATATPRVQDDIAVQLGLLHPKRFIHGFRRHNIAIEVVELPPSERYDAIRRILSDKQSRPAIVYTATRKHAEALGATLRKLRAGAYHAGMDAPDRERIQRDFLDGRLDIVVATIAFGMGIDKSNIRTVIHASLPGSVEGYYQEIGRAGRDGLPARAILLHGFADRKTHEFFQERDYPTPALLESVFASLSAAPTPSATLQRRCALAPDEFDRAIEKLIAFGGAHSNADGALNRGNASWKSDYRAQRDHRFEQLELITRFARSRECRMLNLVRHFGDTDDDQRQCKACDNCVPAQRASNQSESTSLTDRKSVQRILAVLMREDGQATGKLYHAAFPGGKPRRSEFERLLAQMSRTGLLVVSEESFDKDGEHIVYHRACLTYAGKQFDMSTMPLRPERRSDARPNVLQPNKRLRISRSGPRSKRKRFATNRNQR